MFTSQNLSRVGVDELKIFLDSFDDVLCDCDGVVFILFAPIPGAKDGVAALRNLGKEVRFVSNNCTQTLDDFSKTLVKLGLNPKKEDIVIPTIAIISYLKSIEFNKKIFIIGCKAMKREFVDAGFELADYGPDSIDEKVDVVVAQLQDDLDVGAVVIDFDINVNFMRLQKALIYIKRPDVLFMTGGSDMRIPLTRDSDLMGTGYFVNALQEMSGREPLLFGKPGKNVHNYVMDRYKLTPQRTLFIGDSFSDLQFAAESGYQMLPVMSGLIKVKDLENCEDERILPKYYVNDLEDLSTLIVSKL